MEIAEIWLLLGAQVHQDFLSHYPDVVGGLRFIFMNLTDAQRNDLLSFLLEATAGSPSPADLAKLWYSSGADLFVEEGDMPRFFELLLSELKNAIAARE